MRVDIVSVGDLVIRIFFIHIRVNLPQNHYLVGSKKKLSNNLFEKFIEKILIKTVTNKT